MSASRDVLLLTMMGLGLMAGSVRAEDFEAGKSAAKIFEADCLTCHRSPRGLAKGMSSRALVDFLREHYTTGIGPAAELAGYLESGTADGDGRRALKPTAEAQRRSDQRQRSQTVGAPSDATADQPESPVRKHRYVGSAAESEAMPESDAAAPPAHKRHHARSTESTNEARPPMDGQASTSSNLRAAPAAMPQPVTPARESRRKHPRSPRNAEASQAAKEPEMAPRGAASGASEPLRTGTAPAREGTSAAVRGPEPDHTPHAEEAAEPGPNPAPVLPGAVHALQTGEARTGALPNAASGSGDQPTFAAPSP